MEKKEIFETLMAYRQRQMFFDRKNEEHFYAIMSDLARLFGLTDEQAAALSGDGELPDDAITVTEAAQMLGVTTQAISGRIARGKIYGFTDPDEPNPQKATRVSRSDIGNLIMSGADTSAIQHELAATYREATGNIPRGQLWQPCEHSGCNNEPVCMNCMMCEEKHCHCFD